jgi:hypothetical protein
MARTTPDADHAIARATTHAPRNNGGRHEYEMPMERQSGPCPGACAAGDVVRTMAGMPPAADHTMRRAAPDVVCTMAGITPGMVSTIPRITPNTASIITAPNGGREPSPGMSNAIPWGSAPPQTMHPNGVREPGTMPPRAANPIHHIKPSVNPAREEVEG